MFQAVSLIVIAVLTVIDQLTKYIAVNTVKINGPKEFLFGLFQFRYVENTGAAFSSFSDNTLLLTVLTVIILCVCLILLLSRKFRNMFINICLMLVISGGLGNVIDRILYGFVVDFIEPLFIDFAVFNFADCCITVGAFMLIGYEIYELITEKKKKADKND
jgi:signal peptidase II